MNLWHYHLFLIKITTLILLYLFIYFFNLFIRLFFVRLLEFSSTVSAYVWKSSFLRWRLTFFTSRSCKRASFAFLICTLHRDSADAQLLRKLQAWCFATESCSSRSNPTDMDYKWSGTLWKDIDSLLIVLMWWEVFGVWVGKTQIFANLSVKKTPFQIRFFFCITLILYVWPNY